VTTDAARTPGPVNPVVSSAALERFAFHGARAVLTAYLAGFLVFPARDAKAGYHAFLAAAALAPLLVAGLAERRWGRREAVLRLSAAATLGYLLLAAWPGTLGFVLGAALVAAGAGGLQAFTPALAEAQAAPGEAALRGRLLAALFGALVRGALLAALVAPLLLQRLGAAAAFALPAAAMAGATWLLWRARERLAATAPAAPDPHGFFRVVARAARRLGTHGPGQDWLDAARDFHPPEAVAGARAVLGNLGVFGAVTAFWALFSQLGSAWVLQAERLDLSLGPFTVAPAQLQAANPLLVLLLVPALGRFVLPRLAARGRLAGPRARMRAGMIAAALSFVAAAVLQHVVEAGRAPGVLWQLPQYLLLTVGEVLVAVTAQELAYASAPRAMHGAVTSIWFLTVALGNLLTLAVLRLLEPSEVASLWLFAALMALATAGFGALARRAIPADRNG
jgi:POT family proton-dependent oligopeptide transporter